MPDPPPLKFRSEPNEQAQQERFSVSQTCAVCCRFNYWNVSSKNSVLVRELSEMSERMRIASVKKLSIEKRNDQLLEKVHNQTR